MLSPNVEAPEPQLYAPDPLVEHHVAIAALPHTTAATLKRPKHLQVAWLGQTAASLCWIVSVFCYGISSIGDGLQLAAASTWFIANITDLFDNDHQ